MANTARLMPPSNTCASISTRTALSPNMADCGNSSAFCPIRLYLPFWYCTVISRESVLISKVNGCSGISFKASKRVLAVTAKRPSISLSFTSTVVTIVVSLSETVADKVPSCSSKRKQSKIGNAFFELITRLIACKWLESAVLETINFISSVYLSFLFC